MGDREKIFGNESAEELEIGDIVEWTRFDHKEESWLSYYGVLIEKKNEIRSNRLVSISRVVPLSSHSIEMEFFTMTLRKINLDSSEKS